MVDFEEDAVHYRRNQDIGRYGGEYTRLFRKGFIETHLSTDLEQNYVSKSGRVAHAKTRRRLP